MKFSDYASHNGQALHEYAIAIALIAIVGIGGLKLLGVDFSNLLGSVSNADTQNNTQQLFSLVGAKVQGSSSTNTAQTTNVLLKIDPNTGMVGITDPNGGSTNVTSIDGSSVIADIGTQFSQLANTRMSNGQPLPDNIQQLLQQLSASGTELSTNYHTIQQLQPSFNKTNTDYATALANGAPLPSYEPSIVQATVGDTNSYLNFANTYQQLQQQLGTLAQTDPSMATLQTKVANYSGAISSLTVSNLAVPTFSQFHMAAVDNSTLMSSLSQAPLAAQYFTQMQSQIASVPPSQQDQFFQQSFVSAAQQNQVGTAIDANAGLQLALNIAPQSTTNAVASSNLTTP